MKISEGGSVICYVIRKKLNKYINFLILKIENFILLIFKLIGCYYCF